MPSACALRITRFETRISEDPETIAPIHHGDQIFDSPIGDQLLEFGAQ